MSPQRLLLLTAIALTSRSQVSAELLHRWNFEEVSGTTVVDSAGSANGTMVNMDGTERSNDTPFGIGQSLAFDATAEQHVDFGSNFAQFQSDSNFSVSFWYKGTQVSQRHQWGNYGLLSWDSNGIAASVSLQNGRVLYSHFDNGWQTNITSTSPISTGDWNHVALVNYANEKADLWVNGVKEIDGQSSAINAPGSFTAFFRIQHLMRGHGTTPGFVSGLLDDVRVFDHSLTAAEVQGLTAVPEASTFIGGFLLCGAILLRRRLALRKST